MTNVSQRTCEGVPFALTVGVAMLTIPSVCEWPLRVERYAVWYQTREGGQRVRCPKREALTQRFWMTIKPTF